MFLAIDGKIKNGDNKIQLSRVKSVSNRDDQHYIQIGFKSSNSVFCSHICLLNIIFVSEITSEPSGSGLNPYNKMVRFIWAQNKAKSLGRKRSLNY